MRFITADIIFPVSSPPVKNGVIVTEDDGTIRDLINPALSASFTTPSSIEVFSGIICPGFVNAHCHLELSHLKNKLTPGKGLPHFIKEIAANRRSADEEIADAITKAEDEMIKGGMVAVGDISNFNHSFKQKKKDRLLYHTFIEIFDLVPGRAEDVFQKGKQLVMEFHQGKNPEESDPGISITPHAPYTVSEKLLSLISEYATANHSLISIHNQETESENEMFLSRKGNLFDTLNSFGDFYHDWKATGLRSLASTLVHLPACNKIQLVHNTFSSSEDIEWMNRFSKKVWWCTCPNANLFIENKLPDYKLFIEKGCRMTIGTDSYASNRSLSILDEMKTISSSAPFIDFETVLRWATMNGAEFLGFDKTIGSIEKGKSPGLTLIGNFDTGKIKLTEQSFAKKIA
ncbi:MAG: amidohydrolase family protein [Bacteroidetes bacterium]|nr:amidohydrolase family protein [Bacteroidota bacterium]